MMEHNRFNPNKEDEICTWIYLSDQEEGNAVYDTSCGHSLYFMTFSKSFRYCMFCGRKMEVIRD